MGGHGVAPVSPGRMETFPRKQNGYLLAADRDWRTVPFSDTPQRRVDGMLDAEAAQLFRRTQDADGVEQDLKETLAYFCSLVTLQAVAV